MFAEGKSCYSAESNFCSFLPHFEASSSFVTTRSKGGDLGEDERNGKRFSPLLFWGKKHTLLFLKGA